MLWLVIFFNGKISPFFLAGFKIKVYLCGRLCVLRQNEVRYWLYLMDF